MVGANRALPLPHFYCQDFVSCVESHEPPAVAGLPSNRARQIRVPTLVIRCCPHASKRAIWPRYSDRFPRRWVLTTDDRGAVKGIFSLNGCPLIQQTASSGEPYPMGLHARCHRYALD